MPEYDVAQLPSRVNARNIKSVVSPRPIAWISTLSEDGTENLAPFSSYNYVGYTPPVLMFNSPREPEADRKDTARNALATGEFAVNVVTEALLERMDHTSQRIPPNESEFDLAGIERAECRHIDAPRVANAAVTMECTLHDTVEVNNRLMILGDVSYYHVSESVMTDGEIDARKMDTVGRAGGPYYTVTRPVEFERQY